MIRTRCMLIRANFDEKLAELREEVVAVQQAAQQAIGSKAFRQVCEVTLAIGNYLNGGTGKGAAWGFRLDALNKLGGTKSQDGTSTLLHYIARYLEQSFPDKGGLPAPLRLAHEMESVENAARVCWKDHTAEVNSLVNSLAQVVRYAPLRPLRPFRVLIYSLVGCATCHNGRFGRYACSSSPSGDGSFACLSAPCSYQMMIPTEPSPRTLEPKP